MTMGILLIAAGIFALLESALAGIVSVVFLGVLLIAVGILEIFAAFRVHRRGPFVAYVLGGLLSIVVGALFLDRPMATLASLTLLVAGFLFAAGLFRGITAIADRHRQWGWDLAYAVLTLALGAYVVASWPVSSLWVIGTIVAVEIIARGITLVAASWVLRDIEHHGGVTGTFAMAR